MDYSKISDKVDTLCFAVAKLLLEDSQSAEITNVENTYRIIGSRTEVTVEVSVRDKLNQKLVGT